MSNIFDGLLQPEKFLCPQSTQLASFISKDLPGINQLSQGLPEWLALRTYVCHTRRTEYGSFKLLGNADVRACYLLHLFSPVAVRIIKMRELIASPFKLHVMNSYTDAAVEIKEKILANKLQEQLRA